MIIVMQVGLVQSALFWNIYVENNIQNTLTDGVIDGCKSSVR